MGRVIALLFIWKAKHPQHLPKVMLITHIQCDSLLAVRSDYTGEAGHIGVAISHIGLCGGQCFDGVPTA
ncbi:hypothetical protein D9M70_581400 [compost metagenome]